MKGIVSREEFVKTWMTSKSLDEIAQKLGYGRRSIQSIASLLRSKGVKLPKYKTGPQRPSVDVSRLNEVIDSIKKKDVL